MTQTLQSTQLQMQIYNSSIYCYGYVANLSIQFPIEEQFTLCIKNDFGEVRQTFHVDLKKSKGKKTNKSLHQFSNRTKQTF